MNKSYRIGKKFGRLTAVEQIGSYHKCLCDCGAEKLVRTDRMVSGKTTSCGCLVRELRAAERAEASVHRAEMVESRRVARVACKRKVSVEERKLAAVWSTMMQRCYNPSNRDYKFYGGRGIGVEMHWHIKDFFIESVLPLYVRGRWLERKDNSKSYSRENCTFETPRRQCNNRRNTLYLDCGNARKQSLADRCRLNKVSYNTGYKWYSDLVAQGIVPTVELFVAEFYGRSC